MKIVTIVGTRPNFIKMAPIIKEIKARESWEHVLIHTGQHYDDQLSKIFFRQLNLPQPDVNLGIGSMPYAQQIQSMVGKVAKALLHYHPDLVLVVGDVNSTLAGAIAARKINIPVAHVESGLRSFDCLMPEEINRFLTDSMSNILFTPSTDADINLAREGIPSKKVHCVGNVLIDTLIQNQRKIKNSLILNQLKLNHNEYILVTLHRPSNVDNKKDLEKIIQIFKRLPENFKIIFPVHPRAREALKRFRLQSKIRGIANLRMVGPLGYFDFLKLMTHARVVLTDSGGVQEETTFLNVPCLTMRASTERPVTVTHGTNKVIGTDPVKIIRAVRLALAGRGKKTKKIKKWDGKTARRIVDILARYKRF